MNTFKEWLLESESKKQKVCYMVKLMDDCATKMQAIQKTLDIKAGEIVKPDDFHSTIRFMKTDKDTQPLIDWLNTQKLPAITAKIKSFDRLNDAFVAKLDSPEMHKWFDKVNAWMIEHNYPKSDYDTFLPHISFSYETDAAWETPKFDKKEHTIDLDFTYHYITAKPDKDNGPDYKEIWGKKST
jgi:hypothetical protein